MRVLVTGGSGFIGSRVVRRLTDRGYEVRCLLRATSRTGRLEGVSFERATGDITDSATLGTAMAGMDAAIHLACVSSWSEIRKHEARLHEIVGRGTQNVLDAAKSAGVKRVVYVSSAAAVNASLTPAVFDEESAYQLEGSGLAYSVAKHQAERIAKSYASALELVTVLPAEVYGPGDDAFVTAGNIRDILRQWPTLACRGGTSVVHVDDVAEGVVLALERGRAGERYILGGDNLTIADLCRAVVAHAGLSRRVLVLPNRVVRWACRGSTALGLAPPVPLDVLEYATRYWFVNSSKARRELGFAPRGADETIGSVVAWLKEAGHV